MGEGFAYFRWITLHPWRSRHSYLDMCRSCAMDWYRLQYTQEKRRG